MQLKASAFCIHDDNRQAAKFTEGSSFTAYFAEATDLGLQRADRRVLIAVDDARNDASAEHRVVGLQQQNAHDDSDTMMIITTATKTMTRK